MQFHCAMPQPGLGRVQAMQDPREYPAGRVEIEPHFSTTKLCPGESMQLMSS
jgi:hypothetical protein